MRHWHLLILKLVLPKVCRTVLRLAQSLKFVHILVHFAEQAVSILLIILCKTFFRHCVLNQALLFLSLRTPCRAGDCVHDGAVNSFRIKFLKTVLLHDIKLFGVSSRCLNRFHFFSLFQNFCFDVEIQVCQLDFLKGRPFSWFTTWLGWSHFAKTTHRSRVRGWRDISAASCIFEAILNNLKFRALLKILKALQNLLFNFLQFLPLRGFTVVHLRGQTKILTSWAWALAHISGTPSFQLNNTLGWWGNQGDGVVIKLPVGLNGFVGLLPWKKWQSLIWLRDIFVVFFQKIWPALVENALTYTGKRVWGGFFCHLFFLIQAELL